MNMDNTEYWQDIYDRMTPAEQAEVLVLLFPELLDQFTFHQEKSLAAFQSKIFHAFKERRGYGLEDLWDFLADTGLSAKGQRKELYPYILKKAQRAMESDKDAALFESWL